MQTRRRWRGEDWRTLMKRRICKEKNSEVRRSNSKTEEKKNWSEGQRGSVHAALGLDTWVSGGLGESGTRVFFYFLFFIFIVPIDARQGGEGRGPGFFKTLNLQPVSPRTGISFLDPKLKEKRKRKSKIRCSAGAGFAHP